MADKFFDNVSGRQTLKTPITTSSGAGDAGKIPALDGSGKLDSTMMPVGVGAQTKSAVASEALSAGNLVSFWDNSGTLNVRKADATSSGKEADGFVLAAVSNGDTASVYEAGVNTAVTGLSLGAFYFLGTTAGAVTTTAPSAAGNVVQGIGKATATGELIFAPAGRGFVIA